MCRLQWRTTTCCVFILFVTSSFSSFLEFGTAADVVNGCSSSNQSSSSNCTRISSCICGFYSNGTNCTAYSPPIGISTDIRIPDDAMVASSSYDGLHEAREARLDSNISAWCASNTTLDQYLQVNLGKVFGISRIATQGRPQTANSSSYVTSYKIAYSLNADVWYTYRETTNSSEKVFPGNQDANNISCNELHGATNTTPLVARFVRIHPVSWVGHICIRMELYGVPHRCSPSHNLCSANASCAVFRNATVCSCNDGFVGNGRNCTDLDECQGNNTCYANTSCVNTQGSFSCVCKQGYYGNSNNCTDIDECVSSTHRCSCHAKCANTIGSYSCRCTSGYHGNGYTCEDVDECETESYRCHGNASCINIAGSYSCACRRGFVGDGRNCTDIDECRWMPRVCHRHAVCHNSPGSHRCLCTAGYTGDGQNCTVLKVSVSSKSLSTLYLGIVIGLPVAVLSLLLIVIGAFLFARRRRNRVTRRPKSSKVSRPSSTVIGQIDQLFDDAEEKRLRDSVSLRSLQFSIPSVHPSLVALNNVGLTAKNSTYETL